MSRTIVAAALCAALATAAPAAAHEGDPDFESIVTDPGAPGLQVTVLSGDDRLEVRNQTGRVVVIDGYEDEPYARLLPDGRVQVNRRSPAAYLNDEPRGDVEVPATADPGAAPRWETVEGNGRFQFHDHRIHWMADGDPPSVAGDRSARQRVFDWQVPVSVDGTTSQIRGTLWWRGTGGGPPVAALAGLAGLVLGGVVLVVVVRRRRRGAAV